MCSCDVRTLFELEWRGLYREEVVANPGLILRDWKQIMLPCYCSGKCFPPLPNKDPTLCTHRTLSTTWNKLFFTQYFWWQKWHLVPNPNWSTLGQEFGTSSSIVSPTNLSNPHEHKILFSLEAAKRDTNKRDRFMGISQCVPKLSGHKKCWWNASRPPFQGWI